MAALLVAEKTSASKVHVPPPFDNALAAFHTAEIVLYACAKVWKAQRSLSSVAIENVIAALIAVVGLT